MTAGFMTRPFFVLGNPRSGTTLLRLMLTCHPRLFVPPEGGFAVWLFEKYRSWSDMDPAGRCRALVADVMQTRKIETWRLDPEPLTRELESRAPASYAEAVSGIYEWCGNAQDPGFARWGDKNNFYTDHIGTLDATIHVVDRGQELQLRGVAICRMENGQIAEAWNHFDFLPVLMNRGFVTAENLETLFTPA